MVRRPVELVLDIGRPASCRHAKAIATLSALRHRNGLHLPEARGFLRAAAFWSNRPELKPLLVFLHELERGRKCLLSHAPIAMCGVDGRTRTGSASPWSSKLPRTRPDGTRGGSW